MRSNISDIEEHEFASHRLQLGPKMEPVGHRLGTQLCDLGN